MAQGRNLRTKIDEQREAQREVEGRNYGGKLAKLLPPATKFKSNPSGKGQQTFSICKRHEPGRILKTKSILKYEGYVIDEVNT